MSTDQPENLTTPVCNENSTVESPANRSPIQETTTSSSSLVAEPPCALVPSSSSAPTNFLNSLALPQFIDKTTIQELLINLHGFFNNTGLGNVADLLKQELESKGLIPERYGFDGRPRTQTFDNFVNQFGHCQINLLQILSCLNERTNTIIPPSISNLPVRLYSGPRNSLIRRQLSQKQPFTLNCRLASPQIKSLETCRNINVLMARELGMKIPPRLLQRKQAVTDINNHGKFCGHVSPVFCVIFDQTGRYALTGGDDKLIKVWDTVYGRLRYTFRGHSAEISDLAINAENTCLASGSNDKTVRVWRTGNGQPLMVYRKHTALITMVRFTDFIDGDVRYLVSTGNDCTVMFYRYSISTLKFDPEPIRYEEREQVSARGLVLNSSFGGNFVVMGDSSNMIHIYKLSATNVDRIAEFKAHDDRVDSLIFANTHLRFATGSKDGLAKVWEFNSGEWVSTELKIPDAPQQQNATAAQQKRTAYKLLMLGWTCDDTRIITTGSDCQVRIWDWKNEKMLRKMDGHTNEVFVIKPHPVHDDLVFTAGHDGQLMLWDISNGQNLWKHSNQLDLHSPTVAIFDLAVSPQGDRYAYVDMNGMLSVVGIGENRTGSNSLVQQFFANDYDQMFFDENGFLEDVEHVPAHLAPPALLVNIDTHPYLPEHQRHVPGRDFADPNLIKNPWFEQQILPAIPLHDQLLDRMEKSRIELAEYEAGKPLDEEERIRRRLQEEERRRQVQLDRLEKQQDRRNRNRQENEERRQQLLQPRYVLDDNFTDNDSTYSGGSGDRSSADELDDELTQDEELYEDFDSDYEEGGVERETVFRNRSALTVTGRRKKNMQSARRNAEENSQQIPLEDQPSTSSQVTVQKTTRYGRTYKPPTRLVDENEDNVRPNRRRTVTIAPEPSAPTIRHNTRSRRAQILDSDESPVRSPNDQEAFEPTTSKNSERTARKTRISSGDDDEGPDLEELDNKMDEEDGASEATTPEGSLSQSQESSNEEEYLDDEEEELKPKKRQSRGSPKQNLRARKQISSSRSPLSDFSIDSTNKGKVRVLKSGRESRPPKTLAEEEALNKPTRRRRISPRRRSARQAGHHYNFSFEDDVEDYGRAERSTHRQQPKKRYDERSEGSGRSESPVPGPSTGLRSQRLHNRRINESLQVYPEWVMSSEHRRFPYIAQLGDQIVYFVQGHRNYIKFSGIKVSPHYDKEMDLYGAEEHFMVTDIKYHERNNTLVQFVELSPMGSGRFNKKFKFCFHDQNHCPDFLILKQFYDKSRAFDFKPGDRVETLLDDKIYTGIIKSHQCVSPEYPESEWNAIITDWDDGSSDPCCIWDIQPAKPNRQNNSLANAEDIEELAKYEPMPGDWPQLNENESSVAAKKRYQDRCQKVINELIEIEDLNVFVYMVDLSTYADYYEKIKRPVYLQLIIDRIRAEYYRSLTSLKFDIQQIAVNAHHYNEPNTEIVLLSNLLVTTLLDTLDNFNIKSAQKHFFHLKESDTNWQSRHSEKLITDVVDHPHTSNSGPSRSATTSNRTDSWQTQCQTLMTDFINNHLASQPPALHDAIGRLCEDLKTNREYESPQEFKEAIKDLLNHERTDLSRKERRFGELLNLSNVLENQFKSLVSQHQRNEQVRKTRYSQGSTSKKSEASSYNLREKRVLRKQQRHRYNEDEDDDDEDFEQRPSGSKRRRMH